MTVYSVLVTSSPYDSDGARSALDFCGAILDEKHDLAQVFFYQQGVYNAMSVMRPPSDEMNLYAKWVELHERSNAHLRVCVTAGEKRGILANSEHAIIQPPFNQTGLGDFFTELHNSQRLVQF